MMLSVVNRGYQNTQRADATNIYPLLTKTLTEKELNVMANSTLPQEHGKKQEITKELIEELYINQGKTHRECAEHLGFCTHGPIQALFKRYGIKSRPGKFQKGVAVNKGVKRFGSENSGWKGGKDYPVVCIDCEKEFYVYRSEKSNYKRCDECRKKISESRDFVGKRFGLLTVIKDNGRLNSRIAWLCKCDCGKETTVRSQDLKEGKTQSCGDCLRLTGEKHPLWVGGPKIAVYDTYAAQISFCEDVRRDPANSIAMQVKCAYCGKWFPPSMHAVVARIRVLYAQKGATGEARFYCSTGCKESCPTYRKKEYPKGFRKATSREVVPELRQIVLERDGWKCQKCGSTDTLHCHHIKGYTQEKMFANDPDNCITLCKKCHREIHKTPGCGYRDLDCKK